MVFLHICWVELRAQTGCEFQDGRTTWSPCALTLLILFYVKESSFQVQTISPCSLWCVLHLTLLLLLCAKSIHCENSWEICFSACISGGSRQMLETICCTLRFITKGKAILYWFFSELNHFKLVSIIIHVMSLATPSTLYYIVILAFTAFLV